MKMTMKIILAVVTAVVAAGIISTVFSTNSETESFNLQVDRTQGTVNTSMGSPILGSPLAPVTIIEFGDYQCPNCKTWFLNTKPEIISNFIDSGKASLVFVDIAFLGKDSVPAAMASYCAAEQGKYWEYHGLLYTNQQGVDDGWANSERLKAFAFDLKLDMEIFESCLDSGKYKKRVDFNTNESMRNDVSGTPTFFIIGQDGIQETIVGPQPYPVFEKIIESMI